MNEQSSGTVIPGPRLTLRELTERDVGNDYVSWMNDPLVTRYLESRFAVHSRDSLADYVRRMRSDPDILFLAVVRNADGRHIGNIKLGPISLHHLVADIGIVIGDRSCWGHGYATEAIQLLTRYAFERLGLRKVSAGAYSINEGSIRAFLKAGWEKEAVRPSQFLSDEGPVDDVLLGKRRPER